MKIENNLWQQVALYWENFDSPFRPVTEDLEFVEQAIKNWYSSGEIDKILVLGVTPELALIDLPENTELVAVDNCKEMIEHVWPKPDNPNKYVMLGNWLELSLEDESCDLVLSDGPFGVLQYPQDYRKLLQSIRRVMKSNGFFIFRTFIQPSQSEKPTDVYNAAMAGKIKNFTAFQLRLAMSLQPDTETGTRYGDVWISWNEEGPDAEALASRTGWSMEEIGKLAFLDGSNDLFSIPTIHQLRTLLQEEGFKELDYLQPTYETGERCPTLVCTSASNPV